MRYAVLADIHANLPALCAVLEDIQRQSVDGIILAGDFVTGGPAPKQVLELVHAQVEWIILGNADKRLLDFADDHDVPDSWRNKEQWAALNWTCEQLAEEDFMTLARFPELSIIVQGDGSSIRVLHGSPRNIEEHILPVIDGERVELFKQAGLLHTQWIDVRQALELVGEDVLICGHSHIPWVYESDGRLAFNPGSIGAPVDGDIRAHYAIMEQHAGRWRTIPRLINYDLDWQRRLYRESGFLYEGGAMAWTFLRSVETGRNVLGDFMQCVKKTALEEGWVEDRVYPDHIWGRAVKVFDWDRRAA